MAVIAVANQKGGVGKTTIAMNLSWLLSQLGRRVLAIDIDGQRNLTKGWGITDEAVQGRTVYEVLLWQLSVADVITPVAGHHLIPGSDAMNELDLAIGAKQRREERLARQLATISDRYDYVVIDCPPNPGLATLNALYAATHVLIPVQPEQWPIQSMIDFFRSVDDVRSFRPELQILGIVPNIVERNTTHHERGLQYLAQLANTWGVALYPAIAKTTRFRDATAAKKALSDFDRSTDAATALETLAEQIDSRLQDRRLAAV
jgi:chromosome partitioning protein